MKKWFYTGLLLLFAFEIFHIYFIMPMPGSQRMDSIEAAYFLYSFRWIIRSLICLMIAVSFIKVNWNRRWLPTLTLVVTFILIFLINSHLSADHMFLQTKHLTMADAEHNKIELSKLVIGVERNGFARAYPIEFIGYHHQVLDSINNEPIMVTYCTVCRTGRVYSPKVKGAYETFRLVGMDHFNAMFEDATTKSWWRQVNGEAVAGTLKGEHLSEVPSAQTSLAEWLKLYPNSLIMQPNDGEKKFYVSEDYETGKSKGSLTGTNHESWQDKSWVVGVVVNNSTKAYDWNQLVTKKIIMDQIDHTPVIIVVSSDQKSFFAFEKKPGESFSVQNNSLVNDTFQYKLNGVAKGNYPSLKKIAAYQEFWHSWKTFHPQTKIYK